MPRRAALLLVAAAAAAALAVQAATAAPKMLVGIFDDAQTLYGDPATTFPLLQQARGKVVRVTLNWGGRLPIAVRRPAAPTNPGDPAYHWDLYDRSVQYAYQYGLQVLFSIQGTPGWANAGKGANVAPRNARDLQSFAFAAATRYSGTFVAPDGRTLPPVRLWTAWNEPNNPIFLKPQYRKANGKWLIQSAIDYAKICNAVYDGVHATLFAGEKVACGVTGPRGNNNPNSARPSVSPLAFLRALKKAGSVRFDAYAHHPYYGSPSEEPGKAPPLGNRGQPATAVTLGNIGSLLKELTRLYGSKRLWLTEYGYQTNPPDRLFGVTPALQARYLTQSFAIARKNPRIDMMIWFLLRDEPILNGWQSGLMTAAGAKKPSFAAFQRAAAAP